MQWKTDSVSASNSWQGQSDRAIPLEEGNNKDDGANYGVQDLGACAGGGQAYRNGRKNMARSTNAGPTVCGANGGTMVRRVVKSVGQAGNGYGVG